jgi:hypothetical protein
MINEFRQPHFGTIMTDDEIGLGSLVELDGVIELIETQLFFVEPVYAEGAVSSVNGVGSSHEEDVPAQFAGLAFGYFPDTVVTDEVRGEPSITVDLFAYDFIMWVGGYLGWLDISFIFFVVAFVVSWEEFVMVRAYACDACVVEAHVA